MALGATAVSALTIDTNTTKPTDFGSQLAPTSFTGNFRLNFVGSDLDGTIPNSRSPWEQYAGTGPGTIGGARYNSVSGGGTATYLFSAPRTLLSLMWGSPDDYNKLEIWNGGSLVETIFGDNMAITSDPGFVAARQFVNVIITGVTYDKIVFASSTDAFEFANLNAVPVPVPAGILLMATAVAGGVALRRQRARA
jgi:hypothetical protein